MAQARIRPARAGEDDETRRERLDLIARDAVSRLAEHFDSVVVIAMSTNSHGARHRHTWIDGSDYTAFALAKAYVVAEEEKMRVGEM